MRLCHIVMGAILVATAACHPGPIVNTGQPSVGGTIAGIVTTADSRVALEGRKVSALDVQTGSHYDATTGPNGGYSIKVPEGTYRLEVELRTGEAVTKQPAETHVNNSDLDAGRDFVVTVRTG